MRTTRQCAGLPFAVGKPGEWTRESVHVADNRQLASRASECRHDIDAAVAFSIIEAGKGNLPAIGRLCGSTHKTALAICEAEGHF